MRKKRARRLALFLAVVCLVCGLAGCLGAKSPDEYGYAMIIGVDEGQEKSFRVSMLLQRGNGSSEAAAKEGPGELVSVECESLFEAIDMLERSLPFALTLSRASAIVFSEALAESGSIDAVLSASLGTLLIRYYANLLVTRGSAEAYLKGLQGKVEQNVAKLQYNFVEYSEQTGYIPAITLAEFYGNAWSGAGDVLLPLAAEEQKEQGGQTEEDGALFEKTKKAGAAEEAKQTDMLGAAEMLPGEEERNGGMGVGMMGSAVFDGARMVGVLNGTHTQAVMMATGRFKQGRMRMHLPGGEEYSAMLSQQSRPEVSLWLGEKPRAEIKVSLFATSEQPARTAAYTNEQLQQWAGEYIEELLNKIFSACKESGADVFELGKAAAVQFSDTNQWETFDWKKEYAKLEVVFAVDVQFLYNPARSKLE